MLEEVYSRYKGLLFRIAYRMLGSAADAEDIVQDVFVSISMQDWNQVLNPKSYLVKTTINRCINLLQSGSRRKEQYLGPWLPEPMLDSIHGQPEEMAERDERVRYALLVMLQTLSPQERALFILKDILGYSYPEIAELLERTESNCRKIFSRAKQKMNQASPELAEGSDEEAGEEATIFVKQFIHAVQTGDVQGLVKHLREEVALITDGGGKAKAAYRPIFGNNRVLAFLRGVNAKGTFDGEMSAVLLNGESGVLLTRQGRTVLAICFHWDACSRRIMNIYMVMNPDKLRRFQQIEH
ncbi:RNA polymerase sigma factor SigJ [Paenibacillus sp. J2TS4]|uniref:RNA polymerase sigma factor SigJ n=1 Tax=Paenibacillus sp. J2TS4 TaxID=2807194 RepID=UPI001B242051|nr:RNA polymerase sigma factor SigJ [Paenibacillus sp. J2TS4]GIP32793.1 RNA polymerase sigma factor SigJ [Paenibacillus sp. J2TS4]